VFLVDLFSQDAHGVARAFSGLRETLRSNPTPDRLLEKLAADGQAAAAEAMRVCCHSGAITV
jgi:hypothetical protein